ncbi:MAG: hypothetical protein AAFW65_04645 [Pseudomonadota bacterium]
MAVSSPFAHSPGVTRLAQRLEEVRAGRDTLVVGLTGSVASGKTTLAGHLADALDDTHSVETVSTDGFLFPNAVLTERDLMMRKGFPETYDRAAMAEAIKSLRAGAADFPAHSHVTYDIDPALTRRIKRPDLLLLEGLGFTPPAPQAEPGKPDVLIFLDAEIDHIEGWFLERFKRFWVAAKDDPSSFYAQFLHMSEDELVVFAKSVWSGINLPNLTEHILPLRDSAHLVVSKDEDHTVQIAEDRLS